MKRAGGLLAATLLATIALAACGGSSAGLIPAGDANALDADLSALQDGLAAHSCTSVDSALTRVYDDLNRLPASLDAKLRDSLERGYGDLDAHARTQCHAVVRRHHVKSGSTTSTGPTQATSATSPTTGESQTTTTPGGVSTGPTETTSPNTSPSSPTVGPGGGSVAPGGTGGSGASGDAGGTASG